MLRSGGGMYEIKVGFGNDTKSQHILWIELWAEDYTLMPGQRFEIHAGGEDVLPWCNIVACQNATQIDLEACSEYEVYDGETLFECGHHRQ